MGEASGGNALKNECIVTKRSHFLHSKNPSGDRTAEPSELDIPNAVFPQLNGYCWVFLLLFHSVSKRPIGYWFNFSFATFGGF